MQFRVREDITALGYDYFPFMLVVLKIKLIGTNGGRECSNVIIVLFWRLLGMGFHHGFQFCILNLHIV